MFKLQPALTALKILKFFSFVSHSVNDTIVERRGRINSNLILFFFRLIEEVYHVHDRICSVRRIITIWLPGVKLRAPVSRGNNLAISWYHLSNFIHFRFIRIMLRILWTILIKNIFLRSPAVNKSSTIASHDNQRM